MSEHIVSRKSYFGVFAALMVMTVVTVIAAQVNFGNEVVNTIIALTIAVVKAMLVVLIFMHVRHSQRIIWVLVGSGFFWLSIMMALTFSDYLSRRWNDPSPQTAPAPHMNERTR